MGAESVRGRSGCLVCVTWCSISSSRTNWRLTFLATLLGSFFIDDLDLLDVIDSSSACSLPGFDLGLEKENVRIADATGRSVVVVDDGEGGSGYGLGAD